MKGNISEDEKEGADGPIAPRRRRAVLRNKRKRNDSDDDAASAEEGDDEEPSARVPDVGDMLAIKAGAADDGDAQRFWLAQLRKVLSEEEDGTPDEIEILWFKGTAEFGKYTHLLVAGKKHKKYVDTVEFASVFYSFEKLTRGGYIPVLHERRIRDCADDF